mmetsp:Transcript_4329/g.15541  ORF Transcript_4329/g.15541 Transcript_4329/m.15541 type:complete len:278 (+) Transcript_4329:111-944(+)
MFVTAAVRGPQHSHLRPFASSVSRTTTPMSSCRLYALNRLPFLGGKLLAARCSGGTLARGASKLGSTYRSSSTNSRSVMVQAAKGFGAPKTKHPLEFTGKLKVLLYPDPRLRAENVRITTFDDKLVKLAKEMFKVMYATEGVGLSAPQVGVNVRLMVFNEEGVPGRGKEYVLVNPEIVELSNNTEVGEEGCLSFPKLYAPVERSTAVKVKAQDIKGRDITLELKDPWVARIFQHEYDHLDKVLYHDRMTAEARSSVQHMLDEFIAKYEEAGTPATAI